MEKTYRIDIHFDVVTFDSDGTQLTVYSHIPGFGPMTTEGEAVAFIEGKFKGIKRINESTEDAPLPGA